MVKTISIQETTKDKLDSIKQHKRETYDDIINRLLDKQNE